MIDERQTKFTDEMVRRFLLGALHRGEQTEFERSLFTDEDLEERVRLAELELSDDYAANRLNPADRRLFAERFLSIPTRRRQLKISQALQTSFRAPARDPLGQRLINLLDFRQAAWKYAFATFVLLVLLATAMLVTKERSKIARRLPSIQKPATPRPSATAAPQLVHHGNQPSEPVHPEEPLALPPHESLTTDAVLLPNTPLESAPVIRQTVESRRVLIVLGLDEDGRDHYFANLMTTDGETVYSVEAQAGTAQNKINIYVPGEILKAGDYQIRLTTGVDQPPESAAIYYFRVR
jgi:hypothetical protein